MRDKILGYGLVAGLIAGGILFVFAVTRAIEPGAAGMAIGYLTMLIALSTIFVAIKRHRDIDQGGYIRFLPAFGLGLGITVVAGLVYVLAWEAALAVTGGADAFVQQLVDHQRASGASAQEVAEMERFRATYADPVFRLPITFTEIFPVGLLVSLVSALLLRNPGFMKLPRNRIAGAEEEPAQASPET